MKDIGYSNVEKNVYKIMLKINENGLECVDSDEIKRLCDINQNELEKAMCFIDYEELLINYNPYWGDDELNGFSCRGLNRKGFNYLRENSFIGKACGFLKGLKEWNVIGIAEELIKFK